MLLAVVLVFPTPRGFCADYFADYFAEPQQEISAPPQDMSPAQDASLKPAPTCPKCGKPASGKEPLKTCCCGRLVDWSKIPLTIRPMPRPGDFPIPPAGPGYFTLWDQMEGNWRAKAPPSGYLPFALMPPSYFDADFRYVESLDYDDRTFVEQLKRMHLNDCLMFSTGGQVWGRFMNEHNSRLTEADNSYTLMRTRLFGDLNYGDLFRVYGEYIWADSFSEELAPLPIDVNLGDVLNLFVDVNLFDYEGHPVFARVGRQELLLGSQRLVSALDWGNTRRTFDGVRLFRQGEEWDFDIFWTKFVPPQASTFDQADEKRDFAGTWLTHRPKKGEFHDYYYLYFDNSHDIVQQGIALAPTEAHTLGTRSTWESGGLLWDYELMLQFGNKGGTGLFAGAATAGVGRNWKDAALTPTAWIYYDFASGDDDPDSGDAHTFNQLYPFGHYYLGLIDQVGRQNIHDLNAHLFLYPQAWLTVILQYHHFWLAEPRDALYNAGGNAIRRDPTGQSGSNVGDEIDVVLNFHVARYSDVLVGYSHLFGGSFLENTSGPNLAADSELLYLLLQQRW
jgi:hypothetical protein